MSIIESAKMTLTNLEAISKLLASGECIGLPTETVYGLAADVTNGIGIARIFEMKGRPKFNPLICHVSSLAMAREYGVLSTITVKLAEAFWPGPLTMVVPLAENSSLHPLVTAELGTVGLRHPNGIASKIIEHFGKPLAAPSANRSGKISPTTALHVADEFSDLTIIDDGACDVGLESTIIKIENDTISLLRPGAITAGMIEHVIGIRPEINEGGTIEAPGMMKSHYAPNASLELNVTSFSDQSPILAFGRVDISDDHHIFNLSKAGDLQEAAVNLYQGLKTLDATGAKIIQVSPIPNEGLGLAINDRLSRAAAPRNNI